MGTMNTTSVLLVDDQSLVSYALSHALSELPDVEVVGVTTMGEEAVALATLHKPQLVLLDAAMTGFSAFDTAKAIQGGSPGVKIAFLTTRVTDSNIDEAIKVDAVGYIDKSETIENVVDAILQIARGEMYFSPSVRKRLGISPGANLRTAKMQTRRSTLSPRELEVLRNIACGLSAKEVASVLHISERTVNNHRTNLMNKLDIHDRVALARYALREGLATL